MEEEEWINKHEIKNNNFLIHADEEKRTLPDPSVLPGSTPTYFLASRQPPCPRLPRLTRERSRQEEKAKSGSRLARRRQLREATSGLGRPADSFACASLPREKGERLSLESREEASGHVEPPRINGRLGEERDGCSSA